MKKTNSLLFGIAILLLALIPNSVKAQVSEPEFEALKALYKTTDGDNWNYNTGWDTTLTANDVTSAWWGVTVTDGHVTVIDLHQNHLVGYIPVEIGDLTYLTYLSLYINNLSGNIPVVLQYLTNLTNLDLHFNNFSGDIPVELTNLVNLTHLRLHQNDLTGSIPPELINLTDLRRLDLSRNQLTGSIPIELSDLANLVVLDLSTNQLTGTIPEELGNLTNLIDLRLHLNQLSGNIPVSLGNLTKLTQLYLSYNNLNGEIPTEIGNLTDLTLLYLSYNNLIGDIPVEFGNLVNLTELGLNRQGLSGNIPSELENLTKLTRLWLHNNQLEDLPDLSALINLNTLYINDNRFTFEDIEPNIGAANILNYSPQAKVGEEQNYELNLGDNKIISVSVGGSNNTYQWYKDNNSIAGATETNYTINDFTPADAGVYICKINNTVAVDLELVSANIIISEATGNCLTDAQITAEDAYTLISTPFTSGVTTSDITDCSIISYEFNLTYDQTKVEYTGYSLDNTLTEDVNGTVFINDGTPGLLIIGGISGGECFAGAGSLIDLQFNALACGNTMLELANFKYNTTENNSLENGTITIEDEHAISLDSVFAAVGRDFFVPVATDTLMLSCPVDSCSFQFSYDPAHILYLGYTLVGTVDPSATVSVNSSNGQLNVSMKASGIAFSGTGDLIKFEFNALTPGLSVTDIENFCYNTTQITDLTDGTVFTAYYGDVNVDTYVSAFDAAILNQYIVGNSTEPWGINIPWEDWRIIIADVDGDSALTAMDVMYILQYSVGLITEFPVESGKSYISGTDIIITKEDNNFVFSSNGNLHAFEMLAATGEGASSLGQIERLYNQGFYAQNNQGEYRLSLASTDEITEKTPIIRIPTSNIDAEITFKTRINGIPQDYTVNGTSSGAELNNNKVIEIYPNPSGGIFTLKNINNLEIKKIEIYDISGKLISNKNTISKNTIDLSSQGKGIFFIKISTENRVYSLKAVVK